LYYLNEGAGSRIRITIPAGGYVPAFKGPAINPAREQAPPTDGLPSGLPHISILPVEMASNRESEDVIGRVLADELVVGLSRFFAVSIERDGLIATMEPPPGEALSRGIAHEYILKSSLQFLPSSLRYLGCLVVEDTGDIVWDCSIDLDRAEILTVSEQVSDRIADEIFAAGDDRLGRAIDAG
jgi:TolB-like protein